MGPRALLQVPPSPTLMAFSPQSCCIYRTLQPPSLGVGPSPQAAFGVLKWGKVHSSTSAAIHTFKPHQRIHSGWVPGPTSIFRDFRT